MKNAPPQFPLFDYQATAADLMATRERFGLHDEMGIGKTATTIGAIDRLAGKRGIIICPAMLRENWMNEFRRFSTYERRLCKGRTIHDYIAWQRGRFDVLITSYEQATKWAPNFVRQGEFIDFLALDEAHYLKNADANRTRAILGHEAGGMDSISLFAEHAYHVTGTPMSNDPLDVYTFLRFVRAMDLPPDQFIKMFFERQMGTYSARHFVRDDMLTTLQSLVYNNSIRRNHTDVGMQLPPIWLKEVILEGSTIDLQKALEAYPLLEGAIIEAIQDGDFSKLSAEYIAVIRRLVGKAKAVPYAELLKAELDAAPTKRVVFCWHTEPLLHVAKHLRKFGYGVVTAYGDTNERDRQEAVRLFMNDPNTHVFVGNIKVAGVGLTLTSSYEIDMLESDWSPAGNAQALKRVHRYGQRQDVHARFITLANSIDVVVNRIVRDKTASIAQIEGTAMTASPLTV
jgi:SWI/SNF-related matrix-associated actin-dependent regulator of chromatin subfamily A-like protein 1